MVIIVVVVVVRKPKRSRVYIVKMPVVDEIKVLGVVLDRRLSKARLGVGAIVHHHHHHHHQRISSRRKSYKNFRAAMCHVFQLLCAGLPTHSTPADYGTGTDPGLWSDPVQD